jgi:hypothetical protein
MVKEHQLRHLDCMYWMLAVLPLAPLGITSSVQQEPHEHHAIGTSKATA